MNGLMKSLGLIFFSVLLSACSFFTDHQTPSAYSVSFDQISSLPLPPSSGKTFFHQQIINMQPVSPLNGSQSLSFNLAIEANGCDLQLVGFSLWGARLFQLRYDSGYCRVDQKKSTHILQTDVPLNPQSLPPLEPMLASVMLAYWPIDAWQKVLPVGWALRDEGKQRLLFDAQKNLRCEIQYSGDAGLSEPISVKGDALSWSVTIASDSENQP